MTLRIPDLQAQHEGMQKLAFLTGKWVGQARLLRGPTDFVELVQTEEARYKLDGLILMIRSWQNSV